MSSRLSYHRAARVVIPTRAHHTGSYSQPESAPTQRSRYRAGLAQPDQGHHAGVADPFWANPLRVASSFAEMLRVYDPAGRPRRQVGVYHVCAVRLTMLVLASQPLTTAQVARVVIDEFGPSMCRRGRCAGVVWSMYHEHGAPPA